MVTILLWIFFLGVALCPIVGVIRFFVLRKRGYRWLALFAVVCGLLVGVAAAYGYLFLLFAVSTQPPSVWAVLLFFTVIIAAATIAWRADTRETLHNAS